MQLLTVYLVLLLTIAEYTWSAVLHLSKRPIEQLNQSNNKYVEIATKIEPVDNNMGQNQTGLAELPKLLGKQKVAQIRRNFNMIQDVGLDGLNEQAKDFSPEELDTLEETTSDVDSNEDSGDDNVRMFNDYTLSNIGLSEDTGHGHRIKRIDFTKIHKTIILEDIGEALPMIASDIDKERISENEDHYLTKGREEVTASVNKQGFPSSDFFLREVKFNCTEGKYYKRGACNICYCTKASQWKPCTKVKCTNRNELFTRDTLVVKKKDAPFLKLREDATGCIPGQKIKSKDHDGNDCPCVCTLPSVMECPICATADHVKFRLGRKQHNG